MQSHEQNSVTYRFADYTIDPNARVLSRNGEPIALTPRVFDTLMAFVARPGETLGKDELMNQIWADSFVEESNLTQNVAVLRKALGENSRQHKYIVTVPGKGYRFVAEVFEARNGGQHENGFAGAVDETAAGRIKKPVDGTAQTQIRWVSGRLLAAGIATAVLIAMAATVAYFTFKPDVATAPEVLRTRQITSFSGLDLYPTFSPTGNALAFSSNKSGAFEIYVRQLVPGAAELQLTSDGNHNFQPVFSPDGSRIAYYSAVRGGIWVIPSSGGTPKRLTEFGSNPAWSPDGSRIAFQSDPLNDFGSGVRNAMPPSTLWLVASDGNTGPIRLTEKGKPEGGHGAPVFSPDGNRIVFDTNDWASSALWSVAIDSSDLKSVFPQGSYVAGSRKLTASDAVYTSDGESLIFVGDMGLSIQTVGIAKNGIATGAPLKIFDASAARLRHVAVSPEGKRLIYSAISTSSNLFLTELNKTGEPKQLTNSADARAVSPAFSPDGKTIAYQEYTTGTSANIRLMDPDGGNQRQITTGPGFNPSWFPQGDRLGFSSSSIDGSEYRFAAADGSVERKIFDYDDHDIYNGRLTPDGRAVVFNSKRSGTINIWKIPIQGGSAKQMTFDEEMAGFPAPSRDGKWIAMQIKRGDDTHVAYMPFDGGEPIQLTNEPGQSWVNDWSPDSDHVLFAGRRGQTWNIYSVSRTTREVKKLTNFDKLNSYVRYPAWSPLNDRIAYEYAESTGNIWMIELK